MGRKVTVDLSAIEFFAMLQCTEYTPTQWSVIVLSPMDHACFL